MSGSTWNHGKIRALALGVLCTPEIPHAMNLLLVDDNRYLTHCLSNFFSENGHACSTLWDPSKVIGWLASKGCDAIILDLKMPQTDGLSLTKQIRETYGAIPILIFTGVGYEEKLLQAALDAGANGFLSKAMGPSSILLALERIVTQEPCRGSRQAA